MAERSIGVDIGATEVRAVEVAGLDASGAAKVVRAAAVPIADGAVVAGVVKKPTETALAVTQALRAIRAPKNGVVLGLATPGSGVAVRELSEAVQPGERERAIRYQNEDVALTVPLAQSALATHAEEGSAAPSGMVDVSVAAVDDADLDALLKVARIARLAPRAVDLAPVALARSMARSATDFVGAVVDIGATQTTVVTVEDRRVRSLRTVRGGGRDVTEAIRQVTGEDFATAEARKPHLRVGGSVSQVSQAFSSYGSVPGERPQTTLEVELENAVNDAIDAIIDTVAQSIDSDAARFGTRAQMVGLVGGVAFTPGLVSLVQQRLDVQTTVSLPLVAFQQNRHTISLFNGPKVPDRVTMKFTNAVGLALWRQPR